MTETVAVLGAGYAGAGVVKRLEADLDTSTDLIWISDTDYHLVLHESHRCIRDPEVKESITIPVEAIKSESTTFVQDEVVNVDTDQRVVELAENEDVEYDYVVVALGSRTAFYGIPGLKENAYTLKGLDDALGIHEAIRTAAEDATRSDPATIVVGGAGLSGIQSAGEIAGYRDDHQAPIDIYLVEALDEIYPPGSPQLQAALRERLEANDVTLLTGDPIVHATEEVVEFDEGEPLGYDVLVWTGGITGQDALDEAAVEKEHNRLNAESTFRTSDERVFALGDSAVIEQNGDPAPPTAQAAWDAAEVAGANVARAINGQELLEWSYEDKGTVISIGEDAVASDLKLLPVDTFGSVPARFLKKFIAARWIADLTSWNRAREAWSDL